MDQIPRRMTSQEIVDLDATVKSPPAIGGTRRVNLET
jgi:hypothetical protein